VIVGVLLAAGESRRMGSTKALVRKRGQSFMAHGLRHLWSTCDAVVVVLGAGAPQVRSAIEAEFERMVTGSRLGKDLESARRHGARGLEARFVVNKGWRKGMLSSVRSGLQAALALRPRAILVLPVDHPGVLPRTVQSLGVAMLEALGAYGPSRRKTDGFAYALVPRYSRRRGHPIALSAALAAAIAEDRGAADLSDAVRRSARLVGYLDCADPGIVRNVNARGRS
jgi:molybdenum cofactor cytidylyltransferase